MPRKARIDAIGAVHHVIVRGIESGVIFEDDIDRVRFIDHLSRILSESVTRCYAWALGGKTGAYYENRYELGKRT